MNKMVSRLLVLLCLLGWVHRLHASGNASPFGINGCAWSHLGMNTEKFDREAGLKRLKALKEAGAKWDRCDFWWGRIEPEKGKFLWRDVDWVVEQYVKHGIDLMPILCYGSAWQKSDAPVTDEERELFARYVFQTVNRYKRHIKVWEIWNEPNITPFWSPNPDVNDYAKLLKVAYAAAKRADPNCIIVGASTAGTDFAFIEGLLLAGGGEHMDVVSIHPYQGDLGSLSPDTGGLEEQIRGTMKLLAEHGYRKPIYLTELGHRTTGTEGHTEVTEAQQAAYLVRTYVIAMAAGAERIFWFNLQDWEEYWGIMRQDFQRKPSFAAYQQMVKHLEGKRPVGTIDAGADRRAVVFARQVRGGRIEDPIVVEWSPNDDDSMPTFTRKLPANVKVIPLPEPPPLVQQRRVHLRAPALPAQRSVWHDADAEHRFVVALATDTAEDTPVPVTLAADSIPDELAEADAFAVFESALDEPLVAQRDLDGNLVFLLPPSSSNERIVYLYPANAPFEPHDAPGDELTNGLVSVRIPGGRFIESIRLANGYTTRGDQVSGIFSASYEDTAGGWPRVDETATVIEQRTLRGPVIQQHRSHVRFGKDECEYEFTVTLYADSPRISYAGKWLSPGRGATKQVNLGDSFPAGSVITGMYGKATLPSAGVGYGPACVIRPGDHPSVTAVMVSPSGRLNTPGWAKRSVTGAGLFYQTSFPATVSADYFWYETPPPGHFSSVARQHYLRCAIPPALTVGPSEKRRR